MSSKRPDTILPGHGAGGKLSRDLITTLVLKHFHSKALAPLSDSGIVCPKKGPLAYTTDSFVIKPVFFPGGDIGKLAICGTINDLAVSGAIPFALTFACIVEEGFLVSDLDRILASAAVEANTAGAMIVAGDFKVVEKGEADGIFINTSGIGVIHPKAKLGYRFISPGDAIIVTGPLGDHSAAITLARQNFSIRAKITSDCACLSPLLLPAIERFGPSIRCMRDLTRGGLGTALCEIAGSANTSFHIDERAIPVKKSVRSLCEMLGYDPLYLANEGKAVIFCDPDRANDLVAFLKRSPLGTRAAKIGKVTAKKKGRVVLFTQSGGKRLVEMLSGGQLPRIC